MRALNRPSSFRDGGRRRGGVDPVDIVVGIVLAVVIPLLAVVLVRALGVETRSVEADFRNEPELKNLPFERDEVELRWETARRIYQTNAQAYMKNMEKVEDGVLKEHHRQWATKCLHSADSILEELTNLGDDPRFSKYVVEAAAMRHRIQADLEKLSSMDILGLDKRSRALSEREFRELESQQ